MQSDYNDITKDLITKYLAGEASVAEEGELFKWIRQTPANEAEFQRSKKIFELAQRRLRATPNPKIDIDREWDHFISTVKGNKHRSLDTKTGRTASEFALWHKIAAAILLLVVSGAILYYFNLVNQDVTYQAAHERMGLKLPDGTSVTLNRNSRLQYTSSMGENVRGVILEGEGFFEVAHDPEKPFIIRAHDTTIEVVGTSFNVEAYDSLKEIEVVVQSGVVRFAVTGKDSGVQLTAGQKGKYKRDSQELTSEANDDVNFLSWSTGEIVFTDDDITTVIETLNKVYHVNIVLVGDVPASCAVTARFSNQTLESVLHILKSTLNLESNKKGNTIEIIAAGC